MNRPATPAMDRLEKLAKAIQETEEALLVLRDGVAKTIAEMREELTDEGRRLAAWEWIYWMHPDIPANVIGMGLLQRPRALIRSASQVLSNIVCVQCGKPIAVRSRSHMRELITGKRTAGGYSHWKPFTCDQCRKAEAKRIDAERNQDWKAKGIARQARLEALRIMPYQEYLATEEWQERRKQHLRSARYRCQLCNASEVTLNVHHRSYARRGEEAWADLIVLCDGCHGIFHREGKLASA